MLDTLGELTECYRVSDLVFVGGSLVPHGGHNLVEPAFFSRAILTGPHLHNFQAISEALLQAGGLAIVHSGEELQKGVLQLIQDSASRQQLGERAHHVIQEHRGATVRTVERILQHYGKSLQ